MSPHGPHSDRRTRIKDIYGTKLESRRASLSPGALAVAEFINNNRHVVLGLSALEIGLEVGTSDATVVRLSQTLGFSGLRDLKETLSHWLEQVESPVEKMRRTSDGIGNDTRDTIDFVIESQKAALDALGSEENRQAAQVAIDLISNAKAVGIFGIAASGVIAAYCGRLFSRSGIPAKVYNQTGVALAESLLQMARGDVLIMLLHSRAHSEAITALTEAKRLDVPVIMILGDSQAALRSQVAASLVLPRTKAQNVALHSQALFAIEALHLGVSMANSQRSIDTLERLVEMRKTIRPYSR